MSIPLEQRSKEVGVQTDTSEATVRGGMGLDGSMLVLRQAASRRRGRAIVDADAGCKMLSPGDGVASPCTRPTALLCYVLQQPAGDSSRRQTAAEGRDRRWGIVEMKLVVSSLRGRTERVLVRQTVASGSDKEDSPAIPPRQLKSRSVGETYQGASAWLRG